MEKSPVRSDAYFSEWKLAFRDKVSGLNILSFLKCLVFIIISKKGKPIGNSLLADA